MTNPVMRILDATSADFPAALDRVLVRDTELESNVESAVAEIIARVRREGDSALMEYTRTFDELDCTDAGELELPPKRLKQALESLPSAQRGALQNAADRIRSYHERQRQESWEYEEPDGTRLGQRITALDRAGLYVPGGKAAYPSSVLMNAIPAKVAGVAELVMTVPTPRGECNEMVLAAAALAGVDRVFTIGGAQAVAALAYGTETVPAVDKIVGPGNIYVATAKKQVFGKVGIDMIAGPSEVVLVCDGEADPDWAAMDLFAQAEHDELAQSILLSTDRGFLRRVDTSIATLLPTMERAKIIRESLARQGALIYVPDLESAAQVVNRIAPEHLELMLSDARALLGQVRHAGAVFLGPYSAEALGDYCAGPNHVLPTSGTARFSSPLGVYDFQKRTSLIECSAAGASALGATASILARSEDLTAHARSAEYRIRPS